MRLTGKKIILVGAALLLLLSSGGCRGRAPLAPYPYAAGPGYYYPPRITAGYRYRYYPGAEVYYDASRSIYFYISEGVWLSAPVLPRYISIDRNSYVIVELDTPAPYREHHTTIKRYPPGQGRGKQRQKIEERRERLEAEKAREEERFRNKEERTEERRQKTERREEPRQRREENRLEEKGRQGPATGEGRDSDRLRQKEEREKELREIRKRREDLRDSRGENRRREKDDKGRRSLADRDDNDAEEQEETERDRKPGRGFWR